MKKKKKILIIVFALLLFIGITLAYIVGQISGDAIGKANVTADTTDNLQFSVDKDINLNPTQFNVPVGGGGLSDTAVGTATLLANSTNETALFGYYVYFKINTNEYIYTTDEQKPEIVLTITGPTGDPVTSVDGLTYVTAENADGTTVSGFDITTQSGLFNIASNYEITSSSSKEATEQDWIFTVTFINLTTNQSENGGSTLDAEIILSKDERYTLANYIINKVYVEDGVNGLYYHDGQGAYTNAELEAGDNSYRYAGEDYAIPDSYKSKYTLIYNMIEDLTYMAYYIDGKTYLMNDENFETNYITAVAKIYCGEYSCNYEEIVDATLNETDSDLVDSFSIYLEEKFSSGEIATVWGFTYDDSIYVPYYDIYNLNGEYLLNEDYYTDIKNQLRKDGYLEGGVNNFVCFGSDSEVCSSNDLYRIIGVFDGRIKLIKFELGDKDILGTNGSYIEDTESDFTSPFYKGSLNPISKYAWNFKEVDYYNKDIWAISDLNTINFNGNYINYLNSNNEKWLKMIDDTTWKLSSLDPKNNNGRQLNLNSKETYEAELKDINNYINYESKIALMYVSDYGYAFLPNYWANTLGNINPTLTGDDNWLNMGPWEYTEWTLTVWKANPQGSCYIDSYGSVGCGISNSDTYRQPVSARPVFYLKSNVAYISGDGSQENPYRIA